MSVTDLTNTSWLLNNSVSYMSRNTSFPLDFIDANGNSWHKMTIRTDGIRYAENDSSYTSVYNGSWVDEGYKTIYITGGVSVNANALLDWFNANGTQVANPTPPSPSQVITDLTGYTWVGNSSLSNYAPYGWDITDRDGMTGNYALNFTCNNISYTYFNVLDRDYSPYGYFYSNEALNSDDGNTLVYSSSWVSDTYKTIQITGGSDATNSTLISWLQDNGTLTESQSAPSGNVEMWFGDRKVESISFVQNGTLKEVIGINYDAPKDIETTSWNDIKTICKAGKIKSFWQVGEIKSFTFNGYPYKVRLVDLQEGRYTYVSDGTPTHAVFELVQLYENSSSISSGSSSVPYKETSMNTQWLVNPLTYMPIKYVVENIYIKCRADSTTTTTENVSVKLFLPAASELKQMAEYGDYTLFECERESVYNSGVQLDAYDYYKNADNETRKKGRIQNGAIGNYWTRTMYNESMYDCVNSSGGIKGAGPSTYYYYAFCFAL